MTGHENKFQELGRDLVNDLQMYIRSLSLYNHDNKIFLRPLHRMETTINWLVAREGKVHLYGASSTLYLNEEMLQFNVAALPNVNFLLEELGKRDIGGLLIEKSVNQRQLQDFLRGFATDEPLKKEANALIRTENLDAATARLKEMSRVEINGIHKLKADSQRYAYLMYHRLFRFVEKINDPKQSDPPNARAVRILQELIDLFSREEISFLGFSDELNPKAYEAYHVCNVATFAIAFGKHIGLERLQMLDLGIAALRHNLGKKHVPEVILEKKQPLSSEEFGYIKRIPLFSAREILKGGFSWDRLRHAVIAAHLNQPIQDPIQPGGKSSLEGPWLYSRILHLCSCFDSLCTRRPFRAQLQPAEALLLMQKRLGDQFDPYLLRKFVTFFGKMAVLALRKKVNPLDIPEEKRELPEQPLSVLGEGMEVVIDKYWELRSRPFLTQAEEEKLNRYMAFLNETKAGDFDDDDANTTGVKRVIFGEVDGHEVEFEML